MKKKVFIGTICMAIAGIGAVAYSSQQLGNQPSSSDLLMENVEALANTEVGDDHTCYNTITSKDGCKVKYCPTCSFIPGTDTFYAPSSSC